MAVHAEASATDDVPFRASLHELVQLVDARHGLAQWLTDHHVPEEAAGDIVGAASELCTNALAVCKSEVVLCAEIEGDAVVLEVRDDGPGVDELPDSERPDSMSEDGWGLYLVRQLVDVLWLHRDEDGGTCAKCARRFTP
jgi:anti-sigma regulatory factor (Ser/Thr protein kinase)